MAVKPVTLTATSAQGARWRDYYELCKPRVVMLMILTAIVGMCLASPHYVPLSILVWGNIGIALAAGAAATINHLVDQRIDRKMNRTKRRPIVQGRVSNRQATWFASILTLLSMTLLICWVNVLTAVLTALTLIGYAFVYTMYLKHATPQNIVIGGLAGAAPPLLGWTAVTGQCDAAGLLLVAIIFVWTPPHFWALAIARVDDYAKAKVPMLPNTHGVRFTKWHILLYTVLLVAVSMMPYAIQMVGLLYLISALVLGGVFVYYAVAMLLSTRPELPMKTFRYSIIYLMLLFGMMLLDHYLALPF